MEVVSKFRVLPVYVKDGSTRFGKWTLRRFQEEVMDKIVSKKDILLVAPTGAGKTLSLLLGEYGVVGMYPNNELLRDQVKSVDKILRLALGARIVTHIRSSTANPNEPDLLRVYELDDSVKLPNSKARRVAVAVMSGRYIPYEKDESGDLIPKKDFIAEKIVRPICYPSKVGDVPYTVVMTTPDTALMLMSGMYRDFEKVGYMLHNAIVASAEGMNIDVVLSRYAVGTSSELKKIAIIRDCLLRYTWFIDEFHLYGLHEATAILPILHVYRNYVGWDEPIILSSATPKGVLYEQIIKDIKPVQVTAQITQHGSFHTLVRGETEVEVLTVGIKGRGLSKWFKTGDKVPDVVRRKVREILKVIKTGGNVFIIVDRVNQVPAIVSTLYQKYGIQPECAVTIKPGGCINSSHVVVGSESISQGIDRENVKYGIVTTYNWATLLQRFGRIGRKTTSKIVLVLPERKKPYPIEDLDRKTVTYDEFVANIKETYTDVDLSRKPIVKVLDRIYRSRMELIEYTSLIAYAKVSSAGNMMEAVQRSLAKKSHLLNMFFGSVEVIPSVLKFRPSGPPVIVRHSGGEDLTDLGTVIRNYTIKATKVERKTIRGVNDEWLVIESDLAPGRYVVNLSPTPKVPSDMIKYLTGTVTTLGTILGMGYEMELIQTDNTSVKVKIDNIPRNVRKQSVGIVLTAPEIALFYAYIGAGVIISPPELGVVALFL